MKRAAAIGMTFVSALAAGTVHAETVAGPVGSASSFRSTAVAVDARVRGKVAQAKAETGLEMRVRTDAASNTSRLISTPPNMVISFR